MRREEGGFTLVEVLIAASLMLVILFATFNMLENFSRANVRTADLINSIDSARNAQSRLTRDVRDATAATTTTVPGGSVLVRAAPQDLVMRRIDPFGKSDATNATGTQTVRWCLDHKQLLHRQVAAGVSDPVPACPDNRKNVWTDTIQADNIVNGERAVFTYNSTVLEEISSVNTFLAIDRNPAKAPAEATLSSGVFLRNQNRAPVAAFTAVSLGGRNLQLNGQASRDPEGGILNYDWTDGATNQCGTGSTACLPYKSAVANYVAPAAGPRSITLRVTDVDGLSHTVTKTVDVRP